MPESTPNTEKILLSILEVMALTGLSRPTIYGFIATGELKTRKIGRRRLVPRAALQAFISRDHQTPAA